MDFSLSAEQEELKAAKDAVDKLAKSLRDTDKDVQNQAGRALAQVSRFGAELVLARDVVGFESRGPVRAVLFDGAGEIEARSLIVATGVSYRRLEAPGLAELAGRGIYYGANAAVARRGLDAKTGHSGPVSSSAAVPSMTAAVVPCTP